jgi:uncharacterized LabA/DUF88 family protein
MVEPIKSDSKKIALLIDGDNAQPSLIGKILTEASKYGSVTIRRIYGDWTTANMNGWKETLNNHAVQPIQQFRYTIGKNATDSAMIIDSMDILHSSLVDGFCLVSSDSDYTRLATRIREMGFFVMGVGQQKTPKAFVNACNVFIYTENLMPKEQQSRARRSSPHQKEEVREDQGKKSDPIPLLKQAFDMAVREDGWAKLAQIGLYLQQLDPGFDPRTYGQKQLSSLIKAHARVFEVSYQDKNGPTTVYVKLRE